MLISKSFGPPEVCCKPGPITAKLLVGAMHLATSGVNYKKKES